MLYALVMYLDGECLHRVMFVNDVLTWNNEELFREDIDYTLKEVDPDYKVIYVEVYNHVPEWWKHEISSTMEFLEGMTEFTWEWRA